MEPPRLPTPSRPRWRGFRMPHPGARSNPRRRAPDRWWKTRAST